MRSSRGVWLALAVALACGCEYETTNYYVSNYYGAPDAGVADTATEDGDGMISSIFVDGAKLQGSGVVVQDRPGLRFIDIATRGNIPTLITVNLATPTGTNTAPVGGAPTFGEAVGTIVLGVGGTSYTAEVDYIAGQMFTLLASTLTIDADLRTLAGAPAPILPAQMTLAASIGQGSINHGQPPQRTLARYYLPAAPFIPAATLQQQIPMFAKTLRVYALGVGGAAVLTISVRGLGGQEIYNAIAVTSPSQVLPLPNDARSIIVTNSGGVNISDIRSVFELSL